MEIIMTDVGEREDLIAFQVLLPVSMLNEARNQARSLELKGVGAYVRQLIQADLARQMLDAWGTDEEPTAGQRSTWEGNRYGTGSFLLQAVAPPANNSVTVRVRWRRNGGRGHTNFLTAEALRSEFSDFKTTGSTPGILYLRGGVYGRVESVMGYPGGALVTLSLHREYPGRKK
ncbi:MAG: hypothetical protein QM723_27630 [Myxococcaceae bacterium]